MTVATVLPVALLAIGGFLVLLGLLTVARRVVRCRAVRHRRALAESLRRTVLELVAGEPDQARAAGDVLVQLDSRRWSAVEPDLEGLLLKVRGETHQALVSVLERRGTLARALRRTRSRDPVTRARGAEVLGAAARTNAVVDLVGLLRDRDPDVRQVAARALGRIGSARAAEALLGVVDGPLAVPPRIVSTALLRIGVAAHPALVRGLSDPSALRRAVAAEIAGLDGAIDAVPALLARLRADDALEVRIRSARAVGRIGMPGAVEALLAATADHEPPPLRTVAARALGELGSPKAVPRLAELLEDETHRVAANAAAALVRCGAPGLAVLAQRARDPGCGHAREALALAELRGVRPVLPAPGPADPAPAGARALAGSAAP